MKQKSLVALGLALGVIAGAFIAPLYAQQEMPSSSQSTCYVGEGSNAACSGKWIYFAGNTSGVDSGTWIVRMNNETGEIWFKNGKKLTLLAEPD